jgi:hypothetical protein
LNAGGTINLEFNDGELLPIEYPYENYPPPSGVTHCFVLGGCVAAVKGWTVWPSKPGKPDAYNPISVVMMSPGEDITACVGSNVDGVQYLFGANGAFGVFLTGDPDFPMYLKRLWTGAGVSGPNQVEYVDTECIFFNGTDGLLFSTQSGEPQSGPVADIIDILRGFSASAVCVGYDPPNMIVVAGANSILGGNYALAYDKSIGVWSSPLPLQIRHGQRCELDPNHARACL